MAIGPGKDPLHYRVVERSGEGGMGVVWKATDTSLGRDVAIKVLPDDLATNGDRLARFEREARLLATLNHPNVASVYGLHQHGDLRFIAMEFIPGEDLSDRIARGPMSQDDALDMARQVARALDAAHQAGVIHRDLKPGNIRLAPDGSALFLRLDDGIHLRGLDSYETTLVPDSGRANTWALSPDARSLIFFTEDDEILRGGKLRRASLDTGTTVVLSESPRAVYPAVWRDGTVLAVSEQVDVVKLSPDTCDAEVILETSSWWKERLQGISALPDPGHYLMTVTAVDDESTAVEVVSVESGERTRILENARFPRLSPTGHLLFIRDNTLMSVLFDVATRSPVGDQVPLLAGVSQFDLAEDGTLAYLPGAQRESKRRVVLADLDGGNAEVVARDGNPYHTRFSPDGRRISSVGPLLRVYDLHSGSVDLVPFPGEAYKDADHVWTPDSKAIVCTAFDSAGERCVLVRQSIDGTGQPAILMEIDAGDENIYPTGHAPDGSGFIYARYFEDDADLWWMPADGSAPSELLVTDDSEDLARFSPDGRLVAYESNETGRQEVWVRAFDADGPRLGAKWQISTEGGKDPVWSPDGREPYFEDAQDRLITVTIRRLEGDPSAMTLGERRVSIELNGLDAYTQGDQSYDVAPTGDRFVVVQADPPGASEVHVVLNWLDELKRLAPTGR
jgi:Tol biopolymer transport system component